jgi:small subunit ribosomal protein S2
MLSREREKLERVLGGIADLSRLPAALFIVDVKREHIAVKEAHKLNLPVFAVCDTNSNPETVDFPIPANDDASKSIALIVSIMGKAIEEGLSERKVDKEETERKRSEEEGIKAKQEADEQ